MCTHSLLFSPLPALQPMTLAVRDSTPGEEASTGDASVHFLSRQRRSSFTRYQTPSRTPSSLILPLLPRTPSSSRTSVSMTLFGSPREASHSFDVVSRLPPEVAVRIMGYLQPQDLCQVCLVCWRWYQLAQHHCLRRRRKKYVLARREEYLQTKENLSSRSGSYTPQRGQRGSSRLMTVAASPLNIIQPRSGRRHSIPPSPSTFHTPGPLYLLEDVRKLSINEEEGSEVRRCLFPDGGGSPAARSPKPQKPHKHESESLIGRRANKSRLRRL